MQYYIEAFKKYAVFNGRSRRSEYWYFLLFNMIGAILALVLDIAVDHVIHGNDFSIIYLLYALVCVLPSLAVTVRRLHDIGKSGWWFFLNFIPIIGAIILIVFFVQDSDGGENRYGPNPKLA